MRISDTPGKLEEAEEAEEDDAMALADALAPIPGSGNSRSKLKAIDTSFLNITDNYNPVFKYWRPLNIIYHEQ